MLDFSQHPEFEAVKSEYNGHVRYDFKVLGNGYARDSFNTWYLGKKLK